MNLFNNKNNWYTFFHSQAVIVDKTMYISGQIGADPAIDDLVPGGIAPQVEQVVLLISRFIEAKSEILEVFLNTLPIWQMSLYDG